MSARNAIGWSAVGAGLCALLIFGVHGAAGPQAADPEARPEAAAPEAKEEGITVAPELGERLGLKLAALTASSAAGEVHGLARGLDAGPLAAIETEIATARAAAAASSAAAARLAGLAAADQSASRQSVEAARAQAAADAARLRLAQQRIALEYAPGLAAMGDGQRTAMLAAITRGEAALVRVDLPGANGGTHVRLADGGTIRLIGPAAQADARLQSAGLLGIADGAAARMLNAGRARDVVAAIGPSRAGVFVPGDAVVRWRGTQWVYRDAGARFVRIELAGAQPVPGGWLASTGLAAGDRVVVQGAGALIALDRADDLAQEGN
jgi:hypothetical protein